MNWTSREYRYLAQGMWRAAKLKHWPMAARLRCAKAAAEFSELARAAAKAESDPAAR